MSELSHPIVARADDASPVNGRTRSLRLACFLLLLAAYATAAALLWQPLGRAFAQGMLAGVFLAIIALSLPFLWPPPDRPVRRRSTRAAMVLCRIMALDFVLLGVGVMGGSTGGHPPLELMASMVLGFAKLGMVPATIVLLGRSCVRGERLAVVAAGFVCLLSVTALSSLPMWG